MKKIYWMFALLMSLCLIFSAAGAYDSPWDHFSGSKTRDTAEEPAAADPVIAEPPAAPQPADTTESGADPERETIAQGLIWTENENSFPAESEPEGMPFIPGSADLFSGAPDSTESSARAGSFEIESITIAGMDDPSSRKALDMIEGLKVNFKTQKGEAPRTELALSMNDKDLLTYSLQSTSPYYVSSNFLGGNTYMITDADQFEEQLVTAFYHMVESMSAESGTSLPPLEEILNGIAVIRSKGGQAGGSVSFTMSAQNIDPSPLLAWAFPLMGRFVPADADPMIDYRYTDLAGRTHFDLPARHTLPDPADASNATTAVFTGEDVSGLLDALMQFFEANPEITQMINEQLAKKGQGDDITALIGNLKESSAESLKAFKLTITMEQDEYGTPVRITVDSENEKDGTVSATKISVTTGQDDSQSVIDIAGDLVSGANSIPLFRGLVLTHKGSQNIDGTLVLCDPQGTNTEITLASDVSESGTGASVTDLEVNYFSGQNSGTLTVNDSKTDNAFGGKDSVGLITFTHNVSSQPLFSITAATTGTSADPLPALTPADAISASTLTEADYDALAQTFFMQIMSIMMNFM